MDPSETLTADELSGPVALPAMDPATEILVDVNASGTYTRRLAPVGWRRDREIVLDGATLEHCEDGVGGVWCYRRRL